MHPKTLLLLLVGGVPILAVVAGTISFLLMRAGYGMLVWAGAPFVGLLLLAAALGFLLGRAASGRRPPESGDGPSRKRDDV